MIVTADGRSLHRIEKQYDPKLMQLLMVLDDVLHEQGLGLFCTKCHRLGIPDGVRGMSSPEEYVLECGCARRTFRPTGKATVEVQK